MSIKFVPDESKNEYEYAISACLCGVSCRYDGKHNLVEEIRRIYDEGRAVLVCPEVMGGLSTPRLPCEILEGKVVNCEGEDKTAEFTLGAEIALELCKKYNVKKAILKQNSPSCGSELIYDGTFTSRKISGQGITAALLMENGILVDDEK
ncbi:MAG: DUF523 domain-containing protein [Clostridia bacterium]|nr:DUF523 domain-containing protein [Clostridia bacterium]